MWLTVIFPDLCIYVYILTYTPRMAPAHPLFMTQFCALCNVMAHGESRQTETLHQHTEGVSNFNGLLVYDNCYGISCQSLDCLEML